MLLTIQKACFCHSLESCWKIKKEEFLQSPCLKKPCVTSKAKLRRTSKTKEQRPRGEAPFKDLFDPDRFFVREYCLEVEEKVQKEKKQLIVQQTDHYKVFVHWLKVHFSQLSVAWIHLKALRVFVESALRYGLPVRYQALLLQADRKQSKRLEDELASLFGYLDPTATA
ncbi:unnamed protein product, partial [Tetraodon nigroviridis]